MNFKTTTGETLDVSIWVKHLTFVFKGVSTTGSIYDACVQLDLLGRNITPETRKEIETWIVDNCKFLKRENKYEQLNLF
jgi:hypothetical protein